MVRAAILASRAFQVLEVRQVRMALQVRQESLPFGSRSADLLAVYDC